jgi:hypothetical protein
MSGSYGMAWRLRAHAGTRVGGGALTTDANCIESVYRVLDDLYTPVDAEKWLESPQKLLDGGIPRAMIAEGRIAEVIAALQGEAP